MNKTQLFRATLGVQPKGFHPLLKIPASVDIYAQDATLLIAFWPTVGDLYAEPGEGLAAWVKDGADWFKNLAAWKKGYSVGSKTYRAHAGFVAEYLRVKEEIQKQIYVRAPSRIIVTGYSQGAAMATLCHRDLLHNYPSLQVSTTAFASPRVYSLDAQIEFDRVTVDKIGFTFERIEVNGDPVTHLPPWWLNYFHVGPVTRIGPRAKLHVKNHTPDVYLAHLGNMK